MSSQAVQTVRVWDLPTRIFHWALVLAVVALVVSGNIGGDAMVWHFRFGYTVASLLLFRLVWGLVGGHWSRFASFIYSPGSVINYLRGRGHPDHSVGHNPLGAGSVFALLVFLAAQVGTGLISDDEIAAAGPFSKFVSNAKVSLASAWHTRVGKYVLITLVLLHLAAILYYYFRKRENLLRPMLVGDKALRHSARSSRDDARSRLTALVIFAACAGLVGWLVQLAS